jgi:hypothetical protein
MEKRLSTHGQELQAQKHFFYFVAQAPQTVVNFKTWREKKTENKQKHNFKTVGRRFESLARLKLNMMAECWTLVWCRG